MVNLGAQDKGHTHSTSVVGQTEGIGFLLHAPEHQWHSLLAALA